MSTAIGITVGRIVVETPFGWKTRHANWKVSHSALDTTFKAMFS
jgi:hypothetical protein